MKKIIAALAIASATAFAPTSPALAPVTASSSTALSAYVPSGMSADEYAKLKSNEKAASQKKNFGAAGARGFKSRSFNSFVKALENGEADHLFAVDPEKVRRGEVALKDVPYMQRGGSWDNTDLTSKKGGWQKTGFGMTAFNDGKAEVKKSNKYDAQNGGKPEVGIFGKTINWGGGAKGDDVAARAKKNGINNDQQMWRDSGALSQAEIQRMNRQRSVKARLGAKTPSFNEAPKKFFGIF